MNKTLITLLGLSIAGNIFIARELIKSLGREDLYKSSWEWEVRQNRIEREHGLQINRVSLRRERE